MPAPKNEKKPFQSIDLDALDGVAGGVRLTERLRGLDTVGTGYWGIDQYDNGAGSYWTDAEHGQTDLPFDYFGTGRW